LSGRLRKDLHGQLALMDSMVFFAAALAISGVLVSYARPLVEPRTDLQGDADPAGILRVLLRTSIGRPVSIDLHGSYRLDGTEVVATCIAVEVSALSSGASQMPFSSLNAIILEMMNSLCDPVFEPVLTVYDLGEGSPDPVLKLPNVEVDSKNRYASSTDIPGDDGNPFKVVLILYPAALSELVQVSIRDSDLLLSVGCPARHIGEGDN
jgi:hypothetical protein